jgi:hypothetical protein
MPEMSSISISWPAILHYRGDDELDFLSNQVAWEEHQRHGVIGYQPGDRLIDSSGCCHLLAGFKQGEITGSGNIFLNLDEILCLVRAHAAQSRICCVAKIQATSVKEAIEMVGEMPGVCMKD